MKWLVYISNVLLIISAIETQILVQAKTILEYLGQNINFIFLALSSKFHVFFIWTFVLKSQTKDENALGINVNENSYFLLKCSHCSVVVSIVFFTWLRVNFSKNFMMNSKIFKSPLNSS